MAMSMSSANTYCHNHTPPTHFRSHDVKNIILGKMLELVHFLHYKPQAIVECGGAVVRAPALRSRGCEFDSHWVSTLATLGKLLT